MTTNPIRSRQEAIERLHFGCSEALRCLRELNGIHLAIDYPERTVTSSEPDYVLRLRKVFFHIRAVTYWPVATDILHVMGPDIRAAKDYLEPIVMENMYGDSRHSELKERRKNIARILKQLSRFSHPTLPILVQTWDVAGLGKADTVLCLFQLYEILISVVADYGLALGTMAKLLEPSKVPEIHDMKDQAIERFALFPHDAVLQFVEKRT